MEALTETRQLMNLEISNPKSKKERTRQKVRQQNLKKMGATELREETELIIKKCRRQTRTMKGIERKYKGMGRVHKKYTKIDRKLTYIKECQFVNKKDVIV